MMGLSRSAKTFFMVVLVGSTFLMAASASADTVIWQESEADGSVNTLEIGDLKQSRRGQTSHVSPPPSREARASASRYNCFEQHVTQKKTNLSIDLFALTLVKKWCGYAGGKIVWQSRDVYTSTGTFWSEEVKDRRHGTKMGRSRKAGKTWAKAHFRYCPPVVGCAQDKWLTVGITFDSSGRFKAWKG